MIPTSVTGSSPPTAPPTGSNMGGMQINNLSSLAGRNGVSNGRPNGTSDNSVLLGIASLILEGRAMAEDEYAMQTSRGIVMSAAAFSANSGECGRQSPKPSTSRDAFGESYGSSGNVGGATSALSIDLGNYQARKSSNSPELSSSLLRDYYSSSSESASSSVESNHSRWSQKLSQLRQESPNGQHQGLATRQKIAVECPRGSDAEFVALAIHTDHHGGGREEKKSGGDFEIIRRMSINQMNFYNSPNSLSASGSGYGSGSSGGFGGGSSNENFMCSLQSLASNSCLRAGGNPLLATIISSPRYSTSRQLSNSPRLATPFNQYHHHQQHQNNQSAIGQYGGMCGNQANAWLSSSSTSPQVGVVGNSGNNKEYLLRKTNTTQRMAIPSSSQTSETKPTTAATSTPMHHLNLNSNVFHKRENPQNFLNSSNTTNASSATATTSNINASRNQTYPQQGPHCDQFLRKMGLAKGDASETEEHHCDMSYVNITCTRWRAYCIKMENILARGEPICIEVYLGPVGHKLLLEQWIIMQKEKQPPPTMTLPSLCGAIRSQLYFSQISAWSDLIKKSDKTIYETGRIIYTNTPPTTSAAGDLATTTANALANNPTTSTITTATATTSTHHPAVTLSNTPLSSGSCSNAGGSSGTASGNALISSGGGVGVLVGCGKKRPSSPRLNIFYRIKPYDSTACFNSKPNVHNFPNVNVTENCCISVCLKSLPRLTGGIPKIGILNTQQQQQQQQQQQNNNLQVSCSRSTVNVNSPTKTTTVTTVAAEKTKVTLKAEQTNTAATAMTSANLTAATIKAVTDANKPTISKMNCDNNDNLKEQHQQQQTHQQQRQQQYDKTLTATSRCLYSSSSLSPSYAINSNKTKQHIFSSLNKDVEHKDVTDLDLECGQSFDLSAGGDGCGFAIEATVSVGDCDSSNSSLSTNNNCGNLSHREKQLLKYRKRMMKRDKKQQQQQQQCKTIDMFTIPTIEMTETNSQQNRMEQGEDDDDDDDYDNDYYRQRHQHNHHQHDNAKIDCSVQQNIANGQREQLPNNNELIDIIPPTNRDQQQQHHVKMISTGTQTISSNTCTSCGLEKSIICLKCNPLKSNNDDADARSFAYEEMDAESSSSSTASSLSSCDIIHTPRNKAELLLQAIQRTPKTNKKHKHKSKDSSQQMAAIKKEEKQQQQQLSSPSNNNQHGSTNNISSTNGIGHLVNTTKVAPTTTQSNNISNSDNSSSNSVSISNSKSSGMVGCQVCKRQKTQHHFNSSSMIEHTDTLYPDANISPSITKHPLNTSSTLYNESVSLNIGSNNVSKASTECNDVDGDATGNGEEEDNESDGGKMLSSDCVDNISLVVREENVETNDLVKVLSARSSKVVAYGSHETMEEEYFKSSTKLTPHIDRCSLGSIKINSGGNQQQRSLCSTPPLEQEKVKDEEDTSMMSQFKTPTPNEQTQSVVGREKKIQQQPKQPHKHTPKPNLLHIACNFNRNVDEQQPRQQQHQMSKSSNQNTAINGNTTPTSYNPLLLRRSLPKVNLTPIFCNPSSIMAVANTTLTPIPISNGVCSNGSPSSASLNSADINITEASPTFSFESPSSPSPSLTVQKSNSAPTLPNANSNSLSPRFVKTSAVYKRRSRHLSDRSDRSSLGSDEQFSDEDIDSGMYSPYATSPVKLRTRLAAVFGRKPLLGNLEECLLQRRLVPKIEVMGFKLLLGASGGFCPPQLTIPAAAYFYELKGETLSTPYVCEIRLPRKGYTVPRYGTVQATLLNPMGMVVRMFVIPYDMRDMPSLHQTFIRQRILADTVEQSSVLDDVNQNIDGNVDNNGHSKRNVTLNIKQLPQDQKQQQQQQQQQHTMQTQQRQQRSPQSNNENHLGHFISAENMKSLRYSIHLRFQTSRSGRLMLHTDIRLLISRRTDCDTAAAHAKGVLEAPNELITNTLMPTNPKYSVRQDQTTSSKI